MAAGHKTFGNNFALKWTLEEIEKKVNEMYEGLTDEDHDDAREWAKVQYIGDAITKIGLYKDAWLYFERVLQKPIGCKEDEESKKTRDKRESVFRLLKICNDIVQKRLIDKALTKKSSTPMAIFILKNQGWTDQQQIDHTTAGEKIESQPREINVRVYNSNDDILFDESGNLLKDRDE